MTPPELREIETVMYPSSVQLRESDDNLLSDQLALPGHSPIKNVDILNESHVSEGHLSEPESPDENKQMLCTKSIKDQALNNF